MAELINPVMWDEWSRNSVTQAFKAELNETIEKAKEAWSHGAYTGGDADVYNTMALAGVDMLRQVMDLIEEKKIED